MSVVSFDLSPESDFSSYLEGRESTLSKCLCENEQYNFAFIKVQTWTLSVIDNQEVILCSFISKSLWEFWKEY